MADRPGASTVSDQLEISLNRENPFADAMREGRFSLSIEYNTPLREQPLKTAIGMGLALAEASGRVGGVSALAVTDRLRGEASHDPVETAEALSQASGKPLLMTLSGKGTDETRVRDLLGRASSAGVRTVLAVTGDRSDQHTGTRHLGRVSAYKNGYFDSVRALDVNRSLPHGLLTGAAVNPFKYTPEDQYLQYYKLSRKILSGAGFFVAQVGWDMRKLQELQWYMQMRELEFPVLARIALLTQKQIASVHEKGLWPGVAVSNSFAAMLQRESNVSAEQSLAAQMRRIALQVTGCKLLGYNGAQLCGIHDARTLDLVLAKIDEAVGAYPHYEEWLMAWQEHHAGVEFAPITQPFYAFRNLLTPQQQRYNPETCRLTDRELQRPGLRDRLRSSCIAALGSRKIPGKLGETVRKLICGYCSRPVDELRQCEFLCPEACPKRLIHGACGGSEPDGTCEFGDAPCFFRRVLAVAADRRELDILEEGTASV